MTGADRRRRVLLRQAPGRPRLEGVLLQGRVPPLSALIVNRGHFRGYITEPARPRRGEDASAIEARRARHRSRTGTRKLGRADAAAPLMATRSPAALRWLVRYDGPRRATTSTRRCSLKLLGALRGRRGHDRRGREGRQEGAAHARTSRSRGVVIVDGSGLSAYDRLTAQAAAKASPLGAGRTREISNAFVDSLPTAGVNGTLVDRMTSGPAYRNVHAKTGTTDSASALSGFVRTRYVFAILHEREPDPLVVRPRGAGPLRAGPSRPIGALEQLRRAAPRPPSGPSSASTRRAPRRRSAPSSSPRPSS